MDPDFWNPGLSSHFFCSVSGNPTTVQVFGHVIKNLDGSGTLPWNINGSSSFCKGPRTSKVWKSKDPQGPRTLRLCMSEDLCKNYYSHLYFTVVTFLTKIQNWCYITKKNLVKTTTVQKFWMGKTTTIQVFDHMTDHMTKNLDGKNHYHPSFWSHDQKLGQ